jgi:hypothetical protein
MVSKDRGKARSGGVGGLVRAARVLAKCRRHTRSCRSPVTVDRVCVGVVGRTRCSCIPAIVGLILVRGTVGGSGICCPRRVLHTILLRIRVCFLVRGTVMHRAVRICVRHRRLCCTRNVVRTVVRASGSTSAVEGWVLLLVLLKVDVILFVAKTRSSF